MNECFAQVLLSEAAPRCGGNPFIIIFKKCFPPQRGATSANDMRKLGEPRGSLGEPPRKLLKSPGVVNCIIAARRNHQRTAREPPRTAKEPLGTAQEPLGPLGTARNRPGSAKEPTGTLRDRQGTARKPPESSTSTAPRCTRRSSIFTWLKVKSPAFDLLQGLNRRGTKTQS